MYRCFVSIKKKNLRHVFSYWITYTTNSFPSLKHFCFRSFISEHVIWMRRFKKFKEFCNCRNDMAFPRIKENKKMNVRKTMYVTLPSLPEWCSLFKFIMKSCIWIPFFCWYIKHIFIPHIYTPYKKQKLLIEKLLESFVAERYKNRWRGGVVRDSIVSMPSNPIQSSVLNVYTPYHTDFINIKMLWYGY